MYENLAASIDAAMRADANRRSGQNGRQQAMPPGSGGKAPVSMGVTVPMLPENGKTQKKRKARKRKSPQATQPGMNYESMFGAPPSVNSGPASPGKSLGTASVTAPQLPTPNVTGSMTPMTNPPIPQGINAQWMASNAVEGMAKQYGGGGGAVEVPGKTGNPSLGSMMPLAPPSAVAVPPSQKTGDPEKFGTLQRLTPPTAVPVPPDQKTGDPELGLRRLEPPTAVAVPKVLRDAPERTLPSTTDFDTLPEDFKDRYYAVFAAGKTNKTPQEAFEFYQNNYANTTRELPAAPPRATMGPRGAAMAAAGLNVQLPYNSEMPTKETPSPVSPIEGNRMTFNDMPERAKQVYFDALRDGSTTMTQDQAAALWQAKYEGNVPESKLRMDNEAPPAQQPATQPQAPPAPQARSPYTPAVAASTPAPGPRPTVAPGADGAPRVQSAMFGDISRRIEEQNRAAQEMAPREPEPTPGEQRRDTIRGEFRDLRSRIRPGAKRFGGSAYNAARSLVENAPSQYGVTQDMSDAEIEAIIRQEADRIGKSRERYGIPRDGGGPTPQTYEELIEARRDLTDSQKSGFLGRPYQSPPRQDSQQGFIDPFANVPPDPEPQPAPSQPSDPLEGISAPAPPRSAESIAADVNSSMPNYRDVREDLQRRVAGGGFGPLGAIGDGGRESGPVAVNTPLSIFDNGARESGPVLVKTPLSIFENGARESGPVLVKTPLSIFENGARESGPVLVKTPLSMFDRSGQQGQPRTADFRYGRDGLRPGDPRRASAPQTLEYEYGPNRGRGGSGSLRDTMQLLSAPGGSGSGSFGGMGGGVGAGGEAAAPVDSPSGGQGQAPQGGMPGGQMPQGGMPGGQMPQGGMPGGQSPQGGMPGGQMPQGGMTNQMMQGMIGQMMQGMMGQGMQQGAQQGIIPSQPAQMTERQRRMQRYQQRNQRYAMQRANRANAMRQQMMNGIMYQAAMGNPQAMNMMNNMQQAQINSYGSMLDAQAKMQGIASNERIAMVQAMMNQMQQQATLQNQIELAKIRQAVEEGKIASDEKMFTDELGFKRDMYRDDMQYKIGRDKVSDAQEAARFEQDKRVSDSTIALNEAKMELDNKRASIEEAQAESRAKLDGLAAQRAEAELEFYNSTSDLRREEMEKKMLMLDQEIAKATKSNEQLDIASENLKLKNQQLERELGGSEDVNKLANSLMAEYNMNPADANATANARLANDRLGKAASAGNSDARALFNLPSSSNDLSGMTSEERVNDVMLRIDRATGILSQDGRVVDPSLLNDAMAREGVNSADLRAMHKLLTEGTWTMWPNSMKMQRYYPHREKQIAVLEQMMPDLRSE